MKGFLLKKCIRTRGKIVKRKRGMVYCGAKRREAIEYRSVTSRNYIFRIL